MSIMTGRVGTLSASNAAFNWMSAANSLCSFKGNSNYLQQQMLMDSFNYKCYSAMAESEDRIAKEDIKRSFSIFA